MNAKHTPGPWTDKALSDGTADKVIAADGERLCDIASSYRTKAEMTANARLIAAAPELLQALSLLLGDRNTENIQLAEAAIKKAGG